MGSLRIDNKSLRPFECSSHELGSLPTTTIRLRNGSPCTVALGKPAILSPSGTRRSRRRCWHRLLASMSHTSQRTLRGSLPLQRSFLYDSHKRHNNTCHNKKRIRILSSDSPPTHFYFELLKRAKPESKTLPELKKRGRCSEIPNFPLFFSV